MSKAFRSDDVPANPGFIRPDIDAICDRHLPASLRMTYRVRGFWSEPVKLTVDRQGRMFDHGTWKITDISLSSGGQEPLGTMVERISNLSAALMDASVWSENFERESALLEQAWQDERAERDRLAKLFP